MRRVTSYLRLSNERDADAEFSLHAAGERVRLRAPLVAQSQRVDHLSDSRAQVGAFLQLSIVVNINYQYRGSTWTTTK